MSVLDGVLTGGGSGGGGVPTEIVFDSGGASESAVVASAESLATTTTGTNESTISLTASNGTDSGDCQVIFYSGKADDSEFFVDLKDSTGFPTVNVGATADGSLAIITAGATQSDISLAARNQTDSGSCEVDFYSGETGDSEFSIDLHDAAGAVTVHVQGSAAGVFSVTNGTESVTINATSGIALATSLAAPTGNADAGAKGTITYDSGFLYIWVDTDTPKKVALAAIV